MISLSKRLSLSHQNWNLSGGSGQLGVMQPLPKQHLSPAAASRPLDDGWTLRSATGFRTAHTEHTIAITDHGAEILTLPQP